MKRAGKYDAAIMALHPIDGVAVDYREIAEMVGCTHTYIQFIAERALRKLRRRDRQVAKLFEGWL